MTKRPISEIKIEDVLSAYSGKDGKCCCGCSGVYSYNSAHVEEGSKRRGYAISAEDVNDKKVARTLKLIQKNAATAEDEGDFVTVTIGTRMHTVYLTQKATGAAPAAAV